MVNEKIDQAIESGELTRLDGTVSLRALTAVTGFADGRVINYMRYKGYKGIFTGHHITGWYIKPARYLIKHGDTLPSEAMSSYLFGVKAEATEALRYGSGNVVITDHTGKALCHRLYQYSSTGHFGWTAWQQGAPDV